MKKFTLLLLGIITFMVVFAQSEKLTLIEHFTQASCPYCPSGNAYIDEVYANNSEEVIVLRYQVWWPGYDPMYFHNTADVDNRVGYYGVNAVPHSVFEGNVYSHNDYSGITDELINTRQETGATFDITIDHSISANNDSIYLSGEITATENVSGNLKAHFVVMERHIAFEEAPGSNGEKNFHNIMKKMFPDANGTDLPTEMSSGDAESFSFSWKLENVYNVNELAVIAFVQDLDTKEVLQAALSDKKQANYDYNSDLAVIEATNLPPSVCGNEGTVAPTIAFKNHGAETWTNIQFKYRVNNGEESELNWTGTIRHTETRRVELDELTFTPAETNHLYIYGINLDGAADENNENDTLVVEIPNSLVVNKKITLELQTDSRPHEIFWRFFHVDDLATPIARNNPYNANDANILITETIEMAENGCYQFVIQDINGLEDGAYYKLLDANQTLIYEGGDFAGKEIIPFEVSLALSANMQGNAEQEILIYPNPASGNVFVDLEEIQNVVQVALYNSTGQEVYVKPSAELKNNKQLGINTTTFEKGLYFVKIASKNNTYIKKLVLN